MQSISRLSMPRRAAALLALGLLTLGACSSQVQNTGTYVPSANMGMGTLPRPATVYVETFQLDPSTVELDSGIRARFQRKFQGANGFAKQQELTAEVQSAISDTLVQAIGAMGLNTVYATPGIQPQAGDVIIQGEVVKITAGNTTRRTLIGFGAGKSEIFANVQVLDVQPDRSRTIVQTYSASANSGRTPGLAVGGVGAAAGHVGLAVAGAVAGTISRARSSLGRDGESLAKRVATNLGTFFEGQGWVAK
jgi:hypothetical protein